MGSALTSLFERLPENLFGPLAAPSKAFYWDLLLRLYDHYFGPESSPPDGYGYLQRTITSEIERFILDREWSPDADIEPNTPINIRANIAYRSLINAGWLREDVVGVKHYVSMAMMVQRFLEQLRQFAEEGPQVIGGKVQLIHNQLEQVLSDPARQASGFHEAALQARELVATLSATTMRVRDAIDLLKRQETTAAFVRSFFDHYISQLFIRDYHELRTANHPLRHRGRIIEIALMLRDDPNKREAMIGYYRSAMRCTSDEEAAVKFEADVSRFLMFSDIDRHLDRLNESVDRATAQSMAFLTYKLRTQDRLDRLLSISIERLKNASPEAETAMPMMPGHLLSESRLPPYQKRVGPMARAPIKKAVLTIEQRAQMQLKRIMKLNREVTPAQVEAFMEKHLGGGYRVSSDDIKIESIHDLCLFVHVMRLSVIGRRYGSEGRKAHPMLRPLKDYRFEIVSNEITENEYLSVPKFVVTRRTVGAGHAA